MWENAFKADYFQRSFCILQGLCVVHTFKSLVKIFFISERRSQGANKQVYPVSP